MSVATTLVVSVSHLGRSVDVAGVVADLQGAEHGGQDGGEQRGGQRALQQVSWQVSNLVSRAAFWLENGRKLRLCQFCVNCPFKTDSAERSALDLPTRRTPPDLSESAAFSHICSMSTTVRTTRGRQRHSCRPWFFSTDNQNPTNLL